MEFKHWIDRAKKELYVYNNSQREAEILLEYITGKNRAFIVAFGENKLTPNEIFNLNQLLIRRKTGEPIAYIIGEQEFWSLPLYVSSSTLIPRPETECLVEQALNRLPTHASRVLDLGTGTGAIAIAIAKERTDCNVLATDLFLDIIKLAKRNIERLGLININLKISYWFSSLYNRKFELIVSNPPYIDKKDFYLNQGDVRFEPRTALISANKGLADLEYIITNAKYYLSNKGWLIAEHGWKQGKAVRSFYMKEHYHDVATYCDYSGNERITVGRLLL